MAFLIIQHVVENVETFKEVFMDDEARRKRSGSKGARVFYNADNPHDVRVMLEFDTAEHARKHAEGLELHEAIKWATSNVSMPSFLVLEHFMDSEA